MNFSFLLSAKNLLCEIQTQRGRKTPLSVIQDIPTRWNSQLFMIERLCELHNELMSVVHGGQYDGKEVVPEKDRNGIWPTDLQWKVS